MVGEVIGRWLCRLTVAMTAEFVFHYVEGVFQYRGIPVPPETVSRQRVEQKHNGPLSSAPLPRREPQAAGLDRSRGAARSDVIHRISASSRRWQRSCFPESLWPWRAASASAAC